MKITPLVIAPQLPLDGITSGIFPYLGGSVSVDQLRSVVMAYEAAIVPGRQGAKLAAKTPGVLIDPAVYVPQARTELETLFDYDDWLMRQRAAGVPLILTDTPRIRNKDMSVLRKALARWDAIDEPTLVVLPIEPWWLRVRPISGTAGCWRACTTWRVRSSWRDVFWQQRIHQTHGGRPATPELG